MKYINANEILPDVLVKELQKYVQAGYIYIPVKSEEHRSWGELSGYRKELEKWGAVREWAALFYTCAQYGRNLIGESP